MPRRSRMYLPGYPYHVVQRGNNRQACFFDPEDHETFLRFLGDSLSRYGNNLHAYCLMTNHTHLLVTPINVSSISTMMKVTCSRYAQYINKKHSRTGSLWEGRHKSSVVDTEQYLLKCYRYIELNPVSAGLVKDPKDYAWSSYQRNARGRIDSLVTPHPTYSALGNDRSERCAKYRDLFAQALSQQDLRNISKAVHYSMPLGSDVFVEHIEREIGRPVGYAKRGRPTRELIKNKSLRPL